jgi:hypothetical protein
MRFKVEEVGPAHVEPLLPRSDRHRQPMIWSANPASFTLACFTFILTVSSVIEHMQSSWSRQIFTNLHLWS